ncbi:LysR family transcriptional regulator [Halomonas urumqiensis]|uniref:LysR family transcriptional regulator n=1 Tax=Halomonas urumqiensis TaxID=1684789 RepID=A0A2N7UH50_9GAMM|nr:LysR family transcriptional regulator [Halomonas urumqiensis]PMR79754.1 LysR family transcriptional regulator [Halomonas urumqiensis]PTB00957.1 LysR family transcriptional regulator [Halomonas urumqiensis]GHE23008.1 transcriptional regulator [Halomonas urumqiensis]
MDTDLLRAFVTVAECQGFSAAGKVLHRTQSAVSLQIKRLEDQMGKSLFERTSRSVLLTAPGEKLLPYARHMLKLQDEARAALGELPRGELIRFGTSEEQASAYLPALLPRHAEAFPDTRLEVICDISAQLVKAFQEGLLDVVLSIRHAPTQSGHLLGWEPMVWVVAEDHFPVEWQTLPLALNPEGCIFRAHALSALGRQARQWELRYVSQSPTGINLPVQAGLAVTVKTPRSVPEGCRVVGEEEGLPTLGQVEIELHRRPGHTSAALEAFCQALEGVVTDTASVGSSCPDIAWQAP